MQLSQFRNPNRAGEGDQLGGRCFAEQAPTDHGPSEVRERVRALPVAG